MTEDPIHAETVRATMDRFQLGRAADASSGTSTYRLKELTGVSPSGLTAELIWEQEAGSSGRDEVRHVASVGEEAAAVAGGTLRGVDAIVCEPSLERLIGELAQDHAAGGDLCLVGAKGVGKSTVVRLLAARLGYAVEVVHLFNDMSARDLVQRRTTTVTGDTVWENTPLVTAALEGRIAVLDGIERLAPGTLNAVQRLLQVKNAPTPPPTLVCV